MTIEKVAEVREGVVSEHELLGHLVLVENAEGTRVNIKDRLEDPERFTGPLSYDTVINFGNLFVNMGLRNYMVSKVDRWSSEHNPPRGITIHEFDNNDVSKAVAGISEIAKDNTFYDNEEECNNYFRFNQSVFAQIHQRSGLDLKAVQFAGLIRAGVAAGEMLGVATSDQVLIQTKRLHLKGENPGEISVGISYDNPHEEGRFNNQDILIADPAGATFGSVIANLLYLKTRQVQPSRVRVWNAVASHKGSALAMQAIKELGMEVSIDAGGYSPGMNDNYYLETASGDPSVGDAGDALNRFLPPSLRL